MAVNSLNMVTLNEHLWMVQGDPWPTIYIFLTTIIPSRNIHWCCSFMAMVRRVIPKRTPAQNQTTLLKQLYVRVWTSTYSAPNNPQIQQRWPCFVVVPQITRSQQWINVSLHKGFYMRGFYVQKQQPAITLVMTMHLLNALQREYLGIDASRRYITGISSGAFGVWDAIERWPNYFAAAAPIAGAGDPTKAALLKHLPLWIFHGSKDNVVTVRGSRNMFAAIKRARGSHFTPSFLVLNMAPGAMYIRCPECHNPLLPSSPGSSRKKDRRF